MKPTETFLVIDFETALGFRNICEVGIAIVENGDLIESRSWLVRPCDNEYFEGNTKLHGITPEMTADKPSFAEIWPEVAEYVKKYNKVVTHNAQFDINLLLDELWENYLPVVECKIYDTYRIAQYADKFGAYRCKLGVLCKHLGIESSRFHRSEDDAIATAKLCLKELELSNVSNFAEAEKYWHFKCGSITESYYYNPQLRNGGYRDEIKRLQELTNEDSDPNHPLYGKNICFTGTMNAKRIACMKDVSAIGGIPQDSVTAKTDYLVIGAIREQKPTRKQEKAEQLRAKGSKIEIISEPQYHKLMSYNL